MIMRESNSSGIASTPHWEVNCKSRGENWKFGSFCNQFRIRSLKLARVEANDFWKGNSLALSGEENFIKPSINCLTSLSSRGKKNQSAQAHKSSFHHFDKREKENVSAKSAENRRLEGARAEPKKLIFVILAGFYFTSHSLAWYNNK